jgi:hypothetical protein
MVWLKLYWTAASELGLAKISEANQAAAVSHGLAKYLVWLALAQNQTHPFFF